MTPRPVACALTLVALGAMGLLLREGGERPAIGKRRDVLAAPARERAAIPSVSVSASVPASASVSDSASDPASVSDADSDAASILDRLDEGHELSGAEAAALRRTLEDPGAEVPLRAGALRALLAAEGRALFPALLDLFGREDAAPLRPLLARAVARGSGPEDGPLLLALVEASERANDPAALLLALESAVSAAGRDPEDDPTRLDPAFEARVVRGLTSLVQHGDASPAPRVRRNALGALAELGTPDARRALADLASSAPDPADREDASLLLESASD